MKIGVMLVPPETTHLVVIALISISSVRLNSVVSDRLSKAKEVIRVTRGVKVVKNKIAPPFKQAEFPNSLVQVFTAWVNYRH